MHRRALLWSAACAALGACANAAESQPPVPQPTPAPVLTPLPDAFRADQIARAHCLSGCQTLDEYLATLVAAGFGRVAVRTMSAGVVALHSGWRL